VSFTLRSVSYERKVDEYFYPPKKVVFPAVT
jgi:hypothetical protein